MTTDADLDQLKLERFNANSLQAIGLIETFKAGEMDRWSRTSTSTTATNCAQSGPRAPLPRRGTTNGHPGHRGEVNAATGSARASRPAQRHPNTGTTTTPSELTSVRPLCHLRRGGPGLIGWRTLRVLLQLFCYSAHTRPGNISGEEGRPIPVRN
jgi:hypothetical protein